MGVHALDLMIWLTGGIDHVYCQSFARVVQTGTDDTTSMLFRMKNGGVAESDPLVNIGSGVLESSNVNTAEAMVNMIELARQFEMQVKAIRAAEENGAASAQLLRLG